MLKAVASKVGEVGMTALGFGIFGLIFLAPYIVARVIPVQAYQVTLIAASIALLVGILAGLSAIMRPARRAAGVVASLLNGQWTALGELTFCVIIAFVMQFGGAALLEANKG